VNYYALPFNQLNQKCKNKSKKGKKKKKIPNTNKCKFEMNFTEVGRRIGNSLGDKISYMFGYGSNDNQKSSDSQGFLYHLSAFTNYHLDTNLLDPAIMNKCI